MALDKKKTIFNFCVVGVFIVLSLLIIVRHEPWRDETRPWIYARDYPMLSYIVTREIYGASYPVEMTHIVPSLLLNLGLPFSSFSITNFLIMLFSILLFLIYSPFSKIQKGLFVFGYYVFYEYNVIARSWSYAVLFLFCLAVFYKDRFRKPFVYTGFLFLFALTHVYTFILAVVLTAFYCVDLLKGKVSAKSSQSFKKSHVCYLILLFIGFLYIFYPNLHPQNVPPQYTQWDTELSVYHIGTIPTAVIDAFLPIPRLQINFWQSRGISRALYGFPIFLITVLFFIRKIKPFFLYITLCSSLFALFFFRGSGAFRHHGLLFIIFIFSLWISSYYRENKLIPWRINKKVLNGIFLIILSIQVIAGSISYYYDWKYDFSSANRATSFLKENNFLTDKTFIISFPSVEMASILVNTPEYPKFYFLEYGELRSFMVTDLNTSIFNSKEHPLNEITQVIEKEITDTDYESVLLILNREIKLSENTSKQYVLLTSFENNIINDPIFIYKKIS